MAKSYVSSDVYGARFCGCRFVICFVEIFLEGEYRLEVSFLFLSIVLTGEYRFVRGLLSLLRTEGRIRRTSRPGAKIINAMTPYQINQKILRFQNDVREEIKGAIYRLVKNNGGSISIQEDLYYGYPPIYDENARCSILDFSGARLSRTNEVVLKTKSTIRRPHLDNIPIAEMLQVWEILLKNEKPCIQ